MTKIVLVSFVMLSFYANADELPDTAAVPLRPNPEITTGDYCTRADRDYDGVRYKDRVAICMRDVSRDLKAKIYDLYGIPRRCRKYYTVDHYIPLMMGGSNQQENLWPEHRDIKATRQNLEQELYHKLEAGDIGHEYALRVVVHAKLNPGHVRPRGCD